VRSRLTINIQQVVRVSKRANEHGGSGPSACGSCSPQTPCNRDRGQMLCLPQPMMPQPQRLRVSFSGMISPPGPKVKPSTRQNDRTSPAPRSTTPSTNSWNARSIPPAFTPQFNLAKHRGCKLFRHNSLLHRYLRLYASVFSPNHNARTTRHRSAPKPCFWLILTTQSDKP